MKALSLLVLVAAAALCSACHERKQDQPDYDSVRQRSETSHGSLDQQKPADN